MAITYHAGRRIQGLERTGSTATFEDDTFSSGWVQTGTSVTASGGTAGGTTQSLASNDFVEKSLGVTLSDTKWVAEFETNTASIATARSFPIFALTDSAGDINDGDTVWVQSQDTSGTHNYNIRTYLSGSTDQNSSSTLNLSYGTTYYNTLIRSTGAIITLNVYSDSARTTLVGTISITNASTSVGGLNTVATGQTSFGNGAETVSSTLDNVKIYNGITDVSGASNNISVANLADRKHLMVIHNHLNNGTTMRIGNRMNNTGGSDLLYAERRCANGGNGTDDTNINASELNITNAVNTAENWLGINYIMNISGQEKLQMSFYTGSNTSGAGNAPNRTEVVSKFVPSSLTDSVNRWDSVRISGSGQSNTNSNISVLGTD
jgi:hypothetical protein